MIVEVVRLIDRWLKNEEYGLEKMLHEVPRFRPEGTQDPMPAMPCIVNDTEDENVATDLDPAKVPAIVIYGTNGPKFPLDRRGNRNAGTIVPSVIVAAAYITREEVALKAVQDGNYILQAVKRSLAHYNSLEQARGSRTLNTVTIAQIRDVEERSVRGAVGKSQLWGFVLATVVVIDSAP